MTLQITRFDESSALDVSGFIVHVKHTANALEHAKKGTRPTIDLVTPEMLIEASGTGLVLLAEFRGQLVGTGTVIHQWIYNVFVEPTLWRSGVGRRIVEALETHAQQEHVQKIGLFSSMMAIGFYESCGFRRHRNLIIHQQKVVEMYKDLVNSRV